jgi:hypothetical protein
MPNYHATAAGPVQFTQDEETALAAKQAAAATALLPEAKIRLLNHITTNVDSFYEFAVGSRVTEYQSAETQARAYKLAGYTGTVPPYVQVWATPNSQTAQWAADDIIARADELAAVQLAVREKRLDMKVRITACSDIEDLQDLAEEWVTFADYIKSLL